MMLEGTWLNSDEPLPSFRTGGVYGQGPDLEAIGTVWAFVLERVPSATLHSFTCSRWLIDDDSTDDAAAEFVQLALGFPDGTFGTLDAVYHAASARIWLRPH